MGKTKETANLVSNGFLTPDGAGIGIGSDTPSSKLDVLGDVNISGVITATGGIDAIGIQSGGVNITTGTITALNFVGTGNTFAVNGNVVDISISGGGGGGGISNVAEDTTPQLGGDLDLNSNDITGTGNVNITGIITATSFVKSGGTSSQFLKADGSVDSSTYLTSYTETNDLSSAVTWANVPDTNITESSVTQHQAALSITESQISDLQSYLTSYTETQTLDDVLGLGNTSDTGLSVGVVTATSFDGNLTGFDELTAPHSSTTKNYSVTVGSKSDHRYQGTGSGSAYYIDGVESPILHLTPGRTYRFTLSSGDMSSHPFRFYLEADKTTSYTTNVTSTATYTEIVVTDETPEVIHYQCSIHGYMGNSVITHSNKVNTPYLITGLDGANITGVVTATGFSTSGGTSSQFLKADGSVDSSTYLTSYTETDPVVAAINGIVKSDGTTISAASAGTDYLAPTGDGSELSGIVTNIQAGANITVLESPAGNFIVTSTAAGGGGSSGIEIENSGSSVGTAITAINFSTNLTATASGGIATITGDGSPPGNPVSKSSTETTATGGQTVFNGTYTVGFVDVYLNGSKLSSSEFTATNGTSITLTTGATVNDIIEIVGHTFANGSTNVELSTDSTPELSGNLDLKGFDIVDSVGGGTIPGQIDALEIMLFV